MFVSESSLDALINKTMIADAYFNEFVPLL